MSQKQSLAFQEFEESADDFSSANALFLAKHARLAYENKMVVEHVGKEVWKYPKVKFIEYTSEEDDIQAYTMGNEEAIIISFRGTDNHKIQDWVNNLDTELEDMLGGSVHRGFKRSLDFIWEELKAEIDSLQSNGQNIFFTGHSQGGAIANLAAARCIEEGMDFQQVYTFGQPRVGDVLFARDFNKEHRNKLFRIVNYGDYVSRIPTRKAGFFHCGTFYFLDESGQLHRESKYWNQFWDDLGVSLWDLLDMTLGEIEEHQTGVYIQKIAQV